MSKLLLLVVTSFVLSCPIAAQDESSRQIIPEEFTKARPSKSTASSAKGRTPYQAASAKKAASSGNYQQLGLTLWRLRPAKSSDIARIIVQEGDDVAEWTPERVRADTPLKMGEKIRLSFESPQPGYLYVIDRERYADGSVGEPILIFPTTRTREGDNKVAPGRLIEIPAQEDRPNYFTLRQTRSDQIGELVSVIVAPAPLAEITITNKAQKLSPTLVSQWEKQWGAQTEKFEMMGGEGRIWTKAEQEAGADVARELTQDDPGPQTVYRVAIKPGAPLWVNVGLKYKKNAPQKAKSSR
ncbi:MAG TPA: DUF4384 domain-containing protein [Blastocatellia bacterium]|nr:DUF4384 domain-containing protein [Blastocatellia bacterium]